MRQVLKRGRAAGWRELLAVGVEPVAEHPRVGVLPLWRIRRDAQQRLVQRGRQIACRRPPTDDARRRFVLAPEDDAGLPQRAVVAEQPAGSAEKLPAVTTRGSREHCRAFRRLVLRPRMRELDDAGRAHSCPGCASGRRR